MLPNQDTTNKTETLFAPAEQYVYSHIVNRHLRSSEAVRGCRHIALRWRAAFSIENSTSTRLPRDKNCPNYSNNLV